MTDNMTDNMTDIPKSIRYDSYLRQMTGCDETYWVHRIEALIARHTIPTSDPNHGRTDTLLWMHDLAHDVDNHIARIIRDRREAGLPEIDENIACASVLSCITALWSSRVRRAKAFDPRRPVNLRRIATQRNHHYLMTLLDLLFDESLDHLHFPNQKWENPWLPDATDGTFI